MIIISCVLLYNCLIIIITIIDISEEVKWTSLIKSQNNLRSLRLCGKSSVI